MGVGVGPLGEGRRLGRVGELPPLGRETVGSSSGGGGTETADGAGPEPPAGEEQLLRAG